MRIKRIVRQPAFQIAMQGHGINMVLQIVMMLGHGVLQCGRRIVPVPISQKIGFVVDDVPFVPVLEYQVDEPFHEPFDGCECQFLKFFSVAGREIGGCQYLDQFSGGYG